MYYLIFGLLYLLSLLPFFILYRISDVAYFILYHVIGYRKKVVMNNLHIAFPDKSLIEKVKIAKQFYKNLTDTFIEAIKMISISEKSFLKRATIDIDKVIALAKTGKNIQFHSGHQFGWEYANWLIAKKLPIPWIGVYMRINNKSVNKIFYDLRSKNGTILIAAQDFKNSMHQLFSKQYSIGLAADQNPSIPNNAYWLNFFNVPAPFVTGPDKGAIRNNTAVVFVKFIKIKRGYYHFDTTIVHENAAECKAGEITLLYRNFLESVIKENPDNYLWSHRRWKWAYKKDYESRWIDTAPLPSVD